jgi:hypothetical protein
VNTIIGSRSKLIMQGLASERAMHASTSLLHVHASAAQWEACAGRKAWSTDLPCSVHHAVLPRPLR